MINVSDLIMNKSEFETFNTGCYNEVMKCVNSCSDFRASIVNTLTSRLIIGYIILVILILYQIFIKYNQPKYSQTEFYKKWIDKRIDFAVIVFAVGLTALTLM